MPYCGCFHNFNLALLGQGQYEVRFDQQGHVDFPKTFRSAGVANKILKHTSQTVYRLLDVTDFSKLEDLCETLKSKIIVDLNPGIDFCYALGPYMLFGDDDTAYHSKIGALLNSGKYRNGRAAINELGQLLFQFIRRHPILNGATAVLSPPKSQSGSPDLAGLWAGAIAKHLGLDVITATKVRNTAPQKNISEDMSEADAIERVKDSVSIPNVPAASRVLILDDTIRSGGTLIELARALRRAGAASVYGLSAAKDAKFTFGGIDLHKDVSIWT